MNLSSRPTSKINFQSDSTVSTPYILHTHLISKTTTFNMKYSLTLAAIVAVVAAQDISTLPVCSLQCFATAIPNTGCGLTDFACSCGKADQLTPEVTPCIQAACSAADQATAVSALVAICEAVGVPITIPTPGTSSSAAPVEPEPTSSAAPVEPEPTSSAAPVEPEPTSEPEEPEEPEETPAVPSGSAAYPVASSAYPVPTGKPEESCTDQTTITVTKTLSKTSHLPSAPPYPTGPVKPSVPAGSGSGVPYPTKATSTKPAVPEFTGAASTFEIPAVIAGLMGLAAFAL